MDLMDLVADGAKVLTEGKWLEENVAVCFSEKFTPCISDEMRNFATKRFLERQAKNPKLFDGDARHLSFKDSTIGRDWVVLAVGPLKYSVYDICRREFMDSFGRGIEDLPTGAGSCAVIVTSDSKIVMHRRKVESDPLVEVALIGGIYDGGTPFAHIKKEFQEELGICQEDIETLILLGISYRLLDRIGPSFDFLAKLRCSAEQLMRLQENVCDKEGIVFFIDCDPETVHNYIEENHKKMPPCDVMALSLAGRHLWGKEWSEIH